MTDSQLPALLSEFTDGRTELVFDLLKAGCRADYKDDRDVSLVQHCAYYGDVTAIRFLVANGASLATLGRNFDLNAAAFHGHWRLCKYLIDQGADVNQPLEDTGETPLHAALCTADRVLHDRVLTILLSHGAQPNVNTKPNVVTGGFMRDCRTKGETPLHRAAAFGDVDTIRLLLDAGAVIDAKDMNGDTPLSWASWYLRPTPVLRQLCYGKFRIHPENQHMRANLAGRVHSGKKVS
jgi:ankyrin repeat protein